MRRDTCFRERRRHSFDPAIVLPIVVGTGDCRDFQPGSAPALAQPVMIAIAHDRQDPGTHVAAAIAVKAAEGAQERVLHDILRGISVTAEEAREIIGRVELRHDRALEFREAMCRRGKGGVAAFRELGLLARFRLDH